MYSLLDGKYVSVEYIHDSIKNLDNYRYTLSYDSVERIKIRYNDKSYQHYIPKDVCSISLEFENPWDIDGVSCVLSRM